MRWHPAILVLLLICALSKWLLATDIQIQDPSLAGMPLSDAEYNHFFKTLNSPRRVSAVCFLRSMYGCQNALVQTLDLYENHGIVPEGRVCSDLAEMPSFPDFCTLTFYRCTLKKYFVKRIQCPDEISETSSTTQNTNQEPGNTESPSILEETPLTTTTFPTLLTSASHTPTAATGAITTISDTETVPELPNIISDLTSTNPLFDLPTSSSPVTTDSESLLELLTSLDAVIAEQSFPELFTTTLNTEVDFSQHLMSDISSPTPAPTLLSTSNAMTATPVTSVSTVTEPSSEPTPTEATTPVGSVSTNPVITIASAGSPTSASPTPVVIVTATEATTPSVGSVSTNPATTVTSANSPTSASPSPTATEATTTEATTPSVGSVPTNPATTVASTSSPTSASPSPVATGTATSTSPCSSSPSPSSPTASKTSVLLTKPIIPKSPAHLLPPARVAEWPIVPISAVLGQYPLQPTVMQLLLLPPGFGPRKSKPQAIAISSLLPFGARPANIWPKKTMPKPQMNLPTTAKWEKFFLQTKLPTVAKLEKSLQMNSPTAAQWGNFLSRLRDKRVQQLMQKMRELMAKGKGVTKQLLQSTSLQLLAALKNAKQNSVVSLVPKKQLQR
ncbi:mucin-17-like [Crotalus tigris]|uniref:mucin-17-like n=1 Tax=Crotalus tigris TaxID=88082 RepID=UPI00192F25F2|nr:mucin-17-like [Crotalus tigris]